MTTFVIPFGTSEPADFVLKNDGEPFNGDGIDIELEIFKKDGASIAEVEEPPMVEWLDAAAGTVRVTGCDQLEEGNYYVRFRITGAESQVGFFPNGEKADVWKVVAIAGR